MRQVDRILAAAREGCNTTRDLADVTGLSIVACASSVKDLVKDGRLKRPGLVMRREHGGRRCVVFEVSE